MMIVNVKMPATPPLPKRVLIDLHAECNLACPKCLLYGENRDELLAESVIGNHVSSDSLLDIARQLAPASPMVGPALWSEPLINPDFCNHINILKQHGLPVSINTNGLLLTAEISKFLVELEIDSVCISIDALTSEVLLKTRGTKAIARVETNVNTLIETRANNLLPRIGVSFTLEDANAAQLDEFVAKWIGRVDFVRIGEIFDGSTFPSISVDSPRMPCPALYTTMAIQANGNVSICCLDAYSATNVGNVFQDSIADVWNGPALNSIRRQHEQNDYSDLPLCSKCDRWKSYDFTEELHEDVLVRRSNEYTYYNNIGRIDNWSKALSRDLHSVPVYEH